MSDVHTWADGFGVWHARVRQYGAGSLDGAQSVARRAIRDELTERAPRNAVLSPVRLHTESVEHRDDHTAFTFRER